MALPDPAFILPSDAMTAPLDDDTLNVLGDYFGDDTEKVPDELGEAYDAAIRWQIDDDSAAEWAMRKLAEQQAQIAAVEQQAETYKAEIDEWVRRVTKAPRRTAEFFTGHLVMYGLGQLHQHDRKTIDLPAGKVRTTDRRATPRLVVDDAAAFAAWARDDNLPDWMLAEVVPDVPPKVLVSKIADGVVRMMVVADAEGDTVTRSGKVIDGNGEIVPGLGVAFGDLNVKVDPR